MDHIIKKHKSQPQKRVYFSKETDTIEITLFHKDNKSVDIKITERDDA